MSGDVKVCEICLRMTKKLKRIDEKLSHFHDDLCDYAIKSQIPKYCSGCEKRLTQFYDFKNKCVEAQKILSNWRKTKTKKMPANKIYTLLSSIDTLSVDIIKESANTDPIDDPANEPIPIARVEIPIELPVLKEEVTSKAVEVKLEEPKLEATVPKLASSTDDILMQNTISDKVIIKFEQFDSSDESSRNDSPTVKKAMKIKAENSELIGESIEHIDKLIDDSINSYDLNEINDALTDSDDEDTKPLKFLAKVTKDNVTDDDNEKNKVNLTKEDVLNATDVNDRPDISKEVNEKVKNIVAKLEVLANDASTVYDFYNTVLVSDKKNILNNIYKKLQGQKKANTRGKIQIVMNIIENVRTHIEGILKGKLPKKYNEHCREQIKEIVLKMVKEVITSRPDANLDMEFIARCLDDMVPPSYIKLLWHALNRKYYAHKRTERVMEMMAKLEEKYKNPKMEALAEIFQIEYLNTAAKVKVDFESWKVNPTFVNAKYKCEKCSLGYKYEKSLQKHSLAHDKAKGSYTCKVCDIYYSNLKQLTKHNTHTHRVVFRCTLCTMVTRNISAAEGHYNWHKGNKIQCEICGESLTWTAAYYNHLLERHGCDFVCTICALAFPSEKKLEVHKSKHKLKELPTDGVACEHCGLKFISQQVCNRHVSQAHKKRTWYRPVKYNSARQVRKQECVCEHCGAKFASVRQCRLHVTYKHTKERKPKNFKARSCTVCNEEFPSYFHLIKHFKREHPDMDFYAANEHLRTHLCDHCGKKFMNPYDLRDHILSHTGELPHACAECPRRFRSRSRLLVHQLYHRPKSMQCKYCGKLFRTPSNLSNHMRAHIQDRRYKCNTCGKTFLHQNSLNEHVRGVHFNIRRVKKSHTTRVNTDIDTGKYTSTEIFTDSGNMFTDTGNLINETVNIAAEAGNVFTATGNVFDEGNLVNDTGSKTMRTGGKRMLESGSSGVLSKSGKRRRREPSADTDSE